ncbi:acyl-CoA-binding protein [Dioszegia hungarica]|uniref:Acyl-CoA-binding protein n=1 Tax=Dioszegia hungarica TaxID=4972 RepID=A0AA38LW96_9TREE|nr:acyl-CoA-binding protein [Dioszegia hungarica]KAI9638145.1 acyl-CoA-binding protein [Dioszegia hungarica]
MSTQAAFDKAVKTVKDLKPEGDVKPTQDDQLAFYGLFKQATEGDCTTARPGAFDFKGKYKWDAWNKNKGMSKEDAQKQYYDLLDGMMAKSSDPEIVKAREELHAAKGA